MGERTATPGYRRARARHGSADVGLLPGGVVSAVRGFRWRRFGPWLVWLEGPPLPLVFPVRLLRTLA